MIPVFMRLSGFLSYCQPVELDFSAFDVACISGANGAGKSSLLDAITWALFGQARRRDDAIINGRAGTAEVIFDFNYEGNLYRVHRSKSTGKTGVLEFFVSNEGGQWRALTEHTLRDTDERIQQTLRLDYETFTNASFFLQGKADQFSQQRPNDRKRILSSILGLEVWETYRERALEKRRAQESSLASLDNQLAEINAELSEEEDRRARLKTLEENLKQFASLRKVREDSIEQLRRIKSSVDEQGRMVAVLAGQLSAAQQRVQQRRQQLEHRLTERQQYQEKMAQAAEIEAAYTHWQSLRAELERWDGVAANFRQHESRRSKPLMAIEGERLRLEQSCQGLREQQAAAAAQEALLPSLETALKEAQSAVSATAVRLADRQDLDDALAALIDSQSEASAENRRLRMEMDELKTRIDQLKEASGANCPVCGQPLSAEERQNLIARLENEGREAGGRYRKNIELVRQGDDQRKEMAARQAEIKNLEPQYRQQQRAVDQAEDRLTQASSIVAAWRDSSAGRLAEIVHTIESEQYALEARAELAGINAALAELGYEAAAHDAVRKAEQAGRSSEAAVRQLETARAALTPIEREINGLEQQVKEEQIEFTRLEEAFRQADDQYRASAANLPDIEQAENELFQLQEQENQVRMQVGGARQAVEVLKTLRIRQIEKSKQRVGITAQIARLKMLEKACSKDGVPALLIEQALPEIEAQANDLLDRLTNGGMSVRFETQKEFKDKSRDDKRETLDILISDASGTREYELFSGGEAFRVNFAIRLALSRVLAKRAGARLQTLVIDEGFGSQDREGRQRLIEAINTVQDDFAKILVITHLEELKDAFPARIEVEKTSQGSTVTVLT